MRESWRFTYTYSASELIEFLRRIRRDEPLSMGATYMLRREVYLQAQEMGLIRLPEGVAAGNAHTIPFSEVTILNDAINRDE